jgi:GC-rich sequence DNA-binding factor
MARLTQSLSELTTSHAKNTSSLTAISEERAQVEARELELRELVKKADAKRSWFIAFRDWVESVATFLDEKVCAFSIPAYMRSSSFSAVSTAGRT